MTWYDQKMPSQFSPRARVMAGTAGALVAGQSVAGQSVAGQSVAP